MKPANIHLNTNKQPHLWSDVLLGYAYSFIFAFLFIVAQTPALASSIIDDEQVSVDNPKAAGFYFLVHDHHSGHQPFAPSQAPLEPKGADETEANDNADDEVGKISSDLEFAVRLNLSAEKCQLSQHLLSIESRPRISLFILHHSWKSYLS